MQHHQIPIDAIEQAIDRAELDPGEITLDRAHPTKPGTVDTCAAICCTEIGTPFKVIEALNGDEETRPYATQLLNRLRVSRRDPGYCYYFPGVAFTGPVGRYDEKEG